jgi:hypothetical protein
MVGEKVKTVTVRVDRNWLEAEYRVAGPSGMQRAHETDGVARRGSSCEREAVNDMLSQCANGQCRKPFLKLREGKLFLVETDRVSQPGESAAPPFIRARKQPRVVEHYWLCDECAVSWTLAYDRDHGVTLAPLRRALVSISAAVGVSAVHGGAA